MKIEKFLRPALAPDLGEGDAERHPLGLGRRQRAEPALDPGHGEHGNHKRDRADPGDDGEKPHRRIGIEHRADACGGQRDAEDHHQPGDRRRGRPAFRRRGGGEEGEQRGAGRADPHTDQQERQDRQPEARHPCRLQKDGAEGRAQSAQRQNRHAADDPGCAPAPGIGTVAPVRPAELHAVIDPDQRAGQHGRQRKLHHHHAIERRGRQHNDRADRHLHQSDAEDAEPAQMPVRRMSHGVPPRLPSPKAVTIMPST